VSRVEHDVDVVSIHILGKEYRVSCPANERQSLLHAASYLDGKMREIRDRGKVIGGERIAIMAALNVAHDLLRFRTQSENQARMAGHQIQVLQEKIDATLSREPRPENIL
jgi:cell division protein ZapA